MIQAYSTAELNSSQQRAVEWPLSPVLVLAGPGTGKTRTLISRALYLIQKKNIKPEQILAVTYTNKATEEMRARFRAALGDKARDMTIGTFHAFCIRVLRENYDVARLPKHFTVADEDCQIQVMARVAPMLQETKDIRFLLGRISASRLNQDEARHPLSALEKQLMGRYQAELRRNCLIDFDDILFITWRLFFENPPILQQYRDSFRAILVDEFQDTDRVQYEIIKMLAEEHRNIFVVADDDQSIFSWRGANPKNIEMFRRDFAGDSCIELEENYRSTPQILEQAEHLIARNSRFSMKSLVPARDTGAPVRLEYFQDETEEAAFIIREILAQMNQHNVNGHSQESAAKIAAQPEIGIQTARQILSARTGLATRVTTKARFSDFAVLYARHSIGENLEREFMKAGVPCQLVRGRSILDHDEISRAIMLLRIIHNPKDQVTLSNFIEKMVDESTFARIEEFQRREKLPSFRTALDGFRRWKAVPEQERKAVNRVIGMISNLSAFKEESKDRRLSTLLAQVLAYLATNELSALLSEVNNLTDPYSCSGVYEAAQKLKWASVTAAPILIVGANEHLRFLASQLVQRAIQGCQCHPLDAVEAIDYVKLGRELTLAKRNGAEAPRQGEDNKRWIEPVLIVLDSVSFDALSAHGPDRLSIIYVGVDYPACLRWETAQMQARRAQTLLLNPQEINKAERGIEPSAMAMLFKLCQGVAGLEIADFLPNYVALDIETTDLDVETNDIVEVAAIRVREGRCVDHFEVLVKPAKPVSREAEAVHGLKKEDLERAPQFEQILPGLLDFIGEDRLVAHNGYNFDFICLNRKIQEAGYKRLDKRRFFDTLPMAQRLFPNQGASIDALAARFQIETGQRHRAYDDTRCLVDIFERLKQENNSRLRRTSHEALLDIVALGMLIEQGTLFDSNAILIKQGAQRLRASSSTILERLAENFPQANFQSIISTIDNLAAERSETGIVTAEQFGLLSRFDEIVARFDDLPLEEAIENFLDFTSLYQQQDGVEDRNAVKLMTIYAAKGLEFRSVFVVGLEQNMIPSFYAVRNPDPEQMAEQRRLLYVALTRAKEQLTLTVVRRRDGYEQEQSLFLKDLNLVRNA